MKTRHNYVVIQINDITYILFTTLFKQVAFSFQKKVTDFYEQSSQRVSSAVGAYWNPWVTNNLLN